MKRVLFTFLGLLVFLGGLLGAFFFVTTGDAVFSSSAIRKSIATAGDVEIHEGLPHPTWESFAYKREVERPDVEVIADHIFYTPAVAATQLDEIKRRVESASTFQMRFGQKKCGGFHPDFAVSWNSGGKAYHALFCFTCKEAILSDGVRKFHYDLSRSQYDGLHLLLESYASKRPPKPKPGEIQAN